jgi:hypothetical protein
VLHPGRPNVSKVTIAVRRQSRCKRGIWRAYQSRRGFYVAVGFVCVISQVISSSSPLLCPCLQSELSEKLGKMYDVKDPNCIFVFGMRTAVRAFGRHSPVWQCGTTIMPISHSLSHPPLPILSPCP